MDVKKYKNMVANLGCIICGKSANLHHPRFCIGMAQRSPDWLVIPLCKEHHQDGFYGHAIHNGQQDFEKNYMREEELLAETIKRIVTNLT